MAVHRLETCRNMWAPGRLCTQVGIVPKMVKSSSNGMRMCLMNTTVSCSKLMAPGLSTSTPAAEVLGMRMARAPIT